MSEVGLNKKAIEIDFDDYLRKEDKDKFYLRKKPGIKRLANNYLKNARHNLLVAKALLNLSDNKDVKKTIIPA